MPFTSSLQERDRRLGARRIVVEKRKLDGTVASRDHGLLLDRNDRFLAWVASAGSVRERPEDGRSTTVAISELWLAPQGRPWVICAELGQSQPISRVVAHAALPVHTMRSRVAWVDLDLDLELDGSSGISLRDVDDFVRRAREYGYSDEVIDTAWEGIAEVSGRLIRGSWPFDGTLDQLAQLYDSVRRQIRDRRRVGTAAP